MCYRVLTIDGGEEKGEFVKGLGAKVYLDLTQTKDMVAAVQAATNGCPHGVIKVSVSELAIAQSAAYVIYTGTIVLVGLPAEAKVVTQFSTPLLDPVLSEVL